MNNIAKSTCAECHHIFPRTEMQQITVKENAGTSFGVSQGRNGKNRRYSGRTYTRNRKVWMCNSCAAKHKGKESSAIFFFAAVLIIVIIMAI